MYTDNMYVISVRVRGSSETALSSPSVRSTCVFGPLQDGRDLVALLGLADPVAGRRADADGVQVGLHPAQKRRGGGGAVWDLEVHAVGLRDTNRRKEKEKEGNAKIIRLNAADRQFNISEASISLAVG